MSPFKALLQERMAYLWRTDMPLCVLINSAIAEAEQASVARPAGSEALLKYKRRPGNEVQAIQLPQLAHSMIYIAWGAEQSANTGDWLIRSTAGEVWTVEKKSFEHTYCPVINRPGWFDKFAPVWAKRATEAGVVKTKEGESAYAAGDYICYSGGNTTDVWPLAQSAFEMRYEPVEK